MIEFGPKLRSMAVTVASKPVRMAATPMIVPVPIITPRTVRKARSLWVRMVWRASTSPLRNASFDIGLSLRLSLHPEGFDGIELGGLTRRIDAEEQPDGPRKPDSQQHRRPRQGHRHGRQVAHQKCHRSE